MNKKASFILIIVLLAAAGASLWWQNKTSVKAYEFAGQVKEIQGTHLVVSGIFVVENHPELSKPGTEKDVKITLKPDTKLQKTVLYLPQSGSFTPKDLKKEIKAVSLDEFKTDVTDNKVGISVHSKKNIYHSAAFVASEIDYIIPYSEPIQPNKK